MTYKKIWSILVRINYTSYRWSGIVRNTMLFFKFLTTEFLSRAIYEQETGAICINSIDCLHQ